MNPEIERAVDWIIAQSANSVGLGPLEFLEAVKAVHAEHDQDEEARHSATDGLMEAQLRFFGYGEAIDLIESVTRWYA